MKEEASMSKVTRGTVLTVGRADSHWLVRTPEEKDAARQTDIDAGRFHDDGGEPILYGPYRSMPEGKEFLFVEVTSLRPKWLSWNRRPKGLTEGFCKELNRVVLFKRPV